MITVEVFFSDVQIYKNTMLTLWKRGIRYSEERTIDDGAYQYTITEYTDLDAIVNALSEFFSVSVY